MGKPGPTPHLPQQCGHHKDAHSACQLLAHVVEREGTDHGGGQHAHADGHEDQSPLGSGALVKGHLVEGLQTAGNRGAKLAAN